MASNKQLAYFAHASHLAVAAKIGRVPSTKASTYIRYKHTTHIACVCESCFHNYIYAPAHCNTVCMRFQSVRDHSLYEGPCGVAI